MFGREALDGHAIHVFHREVGPAFFGDASIQQAGYIWMLQGRQDLPFLTETLAKEMRTNRQVNEFDGYPLLKMSIRAMRQVDRAHSTAAEEAIDLVGADAPRLWPIGCAVAGLRAKRGVQQLFGGAGIQHRTDLVFQLTVAAAMRVELFQALGLRGCYDKAED